MMRLTWRTDRDNKPVSVSLVDGRVLERGSPDQVRTSAAVREAYLGEEIA